MADRSDSAKVEDRNTRILPQKTLLWVLDRRRRSALHMRSRLSDALVVFPASGMKSFWTPTPTPRSYLVVYPQ